MFIALQHRNFRLLWLGLLVSFSGSLMQTAAILWHVSLLVAPERRALALGGVGLVRVLPVVFFSMVSGVAADVLDRRKLMLVTQTVMALLAAALAAITWRGTASIWAIYVISAASSAAGAFDLPARQALIPNLVPREHLANALSLNTIMFQVAAVTGPAAGGLLIGTMGVAWAYASNALSFLMVIVALLLMSDSAGRGFKASYVETSPEPLRGEGGRDVASRPEPRPEHEHGFSMRSAVDGLRFVFRAPLIRSTMVLDFFATFFSSATALLPIYAQSILHVGAHGYGWLYAAPAAGAIVASAAMVRAVEVIDRRGQVLAGAVAAYGLATVGFGISTNFWLSLFCLAATGAGDTVSMVFRGLIRQLETPDHLRGRMTGVNMIFFMGGPQLGELEAGLVANWLGAVFSVVSGGVGCLVATVWVYAATPALRAYRRMEDVAREPPGITGEPVIAREADQ